MESLRERKRKPRSKSQILTLGGTSAYNIDSTDIIKLAQLISHTSPPQLSKLLEALLTKRELVDIIRRILIAEMILRNKTYAEIHQTTKASSNTISLVQQGLDIHNGVLTDVIQHRQSQPNVQKRFQPDYAERYFRNRIRKGK